MDCNLISQAKEDHRFNMFEKKSVVKKIRSPHPPILVAPVFYPGTKAVGA